MTAESENEKDFDQIEELTAYLDGELGEDDVHKVEQRLASDPEYLAEMQALQRTWDVLDALPQTEPGTSFTKTTMEMVLGEEIKEKKKRSNNAFVWLGRIALMLVLPVALFAGAFSWVRQNQTSSDRVLLENLSAVDNQYRFNVVDLDVEFLEQLRSRGLFVQSGFLAEGDKGILEEKPIQLIPDSIEERKAYVASLDVEEKVELQEKLERFVGLSESERADRVKFGDEIRAHEDRAELTFVLQAYTDWFNKLDSTRKSELLDSMSAASDTSERIRAVASVRSNQAQEVFGSTGATRLPTADDVATVFTWYEGMIGAKSANIRESFPLLVRRFEASSGMSPTPDSYLDRAARHAPIHRLVTMLMKADPDYMEDLLLQEEDISMLYGFLSPQAQNTLDRLTEARQRSLVFQWIQSANQSKWQVSSSRLREFYQGLSKEEKNQLDKMSNENFDKALKSKFRERSKQRFNQADDFESLLEMEGFNQNRRNRR